MNAPTRVLRFEYCISIVFLTWRRESELVEVPVDHSSFFAALPYNLITFTLGWWGIPWGLLFTPLILWNNLNGGRDVTEELARQEFTSEPSVGEFAKKADAP